jgi:hypothetical protein
LVYVEVGVKLIVPVRNAADALVLKEQVEEFYLDFTWRYTPQVNNWLGDEIITPGTVEFDFADEQMATYFQLKWAK